MKLLTAQCELTKAQEVVGKHWHEDYYRYRDSPVRNPSYQQVIIGGSKVSLCARHRDLYKLWSEIIKASNSKPRKTTPNTAPVRQFIETVRTGSHREWIPRSPDDTKHGFHRIVEEFKTVYHDCLVPKSWLEQHAQDHRDYIPTIEIQANSKSLSVNGNWKAGMIKNFMRGKG